VINIDQTDLYEWAATNAPNRRVLHESLKCEKIILNRFQNLARQTDFSQSLFEAQFPNRRGTDVSHFHEKNLVWSGWSS
jgi:hypothetical protein